MLRTLMLTLLGLVLAILLAVVGVVLFLNSERGQKWLYDKTLQTLQETLQTRVAVGHIGISLLRGELMLTDVEIDDRDSEPMLKVDTLEGAVDLTKIWYREIGLRRVRLAGADMLLYKQTPDSAANYQFMIDALKSKTKKSEDEAEKKKNFHFCMDTVVADVSRTHLTWDVRSLPRLQKGKLDPAHIALRNFNARLQCSLDEDSTKAFTLSNITINEENSDMHLVCDGLQIRKGEQLHMRIDSLRYKYNNHRPRKNKGRPHRGWFDPGHVDIVLSTEAVIHKVGKDTLLLTLNNLTATERECGLYIRRLQTQLEKYGDMLLCSDLRIAMAHTMVNINRLSAELLHDKTRAFRLNENCHVSAHVILTDIARPFAPPLAHFTTPLELTVDVSGDLKRLLFNNIRVTTPDRRLSLSSSGDICNTLEKQLLCLHFNGIRLSARGGIKEQIVSHFAKSTRLKMMKQLAAVGDIRYDGQLGIYHKREDIGGTLYTKFGNVKFAFTLNGNTKYMTGNLSTEAVDLGAIMNIKGLQVSNTHAEYSFNISSKRGKRGGRLPQGWLKASVDGAKYKILSFRDIHADMTCDGTDATGTVTGTQKLISMVCDFVYHQTDNEQSFHVKPHLKLNKKEKKEKDVAGNEKKKTAASDSTTKKKSWLGKLFSKKKNKTDNTQ